MSKKGTLIFFCGKMGAGKSTIAQELALEPKTVLLSEDEWLAVLYPDEINNFNDYLKYSSRLKPLLKDHVGSILNFGLTVVMDFPGNTVKQRAWFKEIVSKNRAAHKLIYLDVDDQLCLKQIKQRRDGNPERVQFDTEETFHQLASYFEAPSGEEGFNIDVIRRKNL